MVFRVSQRGSDVLKRVGSWNWSEKGTNETFLYTLVRKAFGSRSFGSQLRLPAQCRGKDPCHRLKDLI